MKTTTKRAAVNAALAGALAAGVWLRASGLDASIQGDELALYQSVTSAPGASQLGGVSPLLAWLVSAGIRLWDNEIGLRLVSFLSGSIAIPLLYAIARRAASPFAGLVAAWLLALHPAHLAWSQHASGHAFAAALLLAAVLLVQRPFAHRSASAWAFAAALGALALWQASTVGAAVPNASWNWFGAVDDLFRPARKPIVYGVLLYLFGSIGLLALLRRRQAIGGALVVLLLARDFADELLLPLGLVAVAVGLAALAALPPPRIRWMRAAAATACILLLMPSTLAAMNRYRADHPGEDWKGLHHFIAPYLEPGTVIFNLDPTGTRHAALRGVRRDYYLQRMHPHGPTLYHHLREDGGLLDRDRLATLAASAGDHSLVVVGFGEDIAEAGDLLVRWADDTRDFGKVRVWLFGAPTMNLFAEAGFEGIPANMDPAVEAGVVADGEAYQGAHHLRVQSAESADIHALVPLIPTPRDAGVALRNADFVAWDGAAPAGWRVEHGANALMQGTHPDDPTMPVLKLRASPERVRIAQPAPSGLALGHDMTVTARAVAHAPETLSIGLRYTRLGTLERREVPHPGNGNWVTLQLRTTIPPDADGGSIVVEVSRAGSAETESAVTGVSVEVMETSLSLDPDGLYALSLMLRHDGLKPLDTESADQHGGTLRLLFTAPGMGDNSIDLLRLSGSRGWQRHAFRIEPGVTVPSEVSNLTLQAHLHGTGTIRLDEVQLERREHATPFTEGARRPLRERLALEALQPPAE